MKLHLKSALAILAMAFTSTAAQASIAYGSINNFDTVNDTEHECHGFEIEIEDCHSTDITYTYDYNHYGTSHITEDNSVPGHPKCIIRWESKKNANGSWAAFTAIPSGPITPTDGHRFTDPSVNFGGEHFGVGYNKAVGAITYNWLIDNGAGVLVHGGAVQVATPVFVYYPPFNGNVGQVQAAIRPPEPPEVHPLEFGPPVWVKEIRTTSHNNKKVKLRELVSDDPNDANEVNWKNGEPDEVETEWQLLQTEFATVDGGPNGELAAAAEDLGNGDEVVTRRYEFFKYTGPIDNETGEAMGDNVAADGIHGVGTKTINGVEVDLSLIEVVGEFTGAQMAAVDVDAAVGLIEHVSDGRVNSPYTARTIVVQGSWPAFVTRSGALPAGMTFDEVTGVLSGNPTASGTFIFTITASDGVNPDVSKKYTMRIAAIGEELPATSLVDTTASPVGTGTTTGDGAFAPGTNVTVNATATAGFHFVSWTDNGKVVSNSTSYTFTIDVHHSLVANFALTVPQRIITTSASPSIGGTTSAGGTVDDGSSITLTATPNLGYVFSKWTEGGVQVSTSRNYTFTVTADRTLVANFTVVPTYTVTTSASPAAGGTTTGGGTFSSGTSATVTATANAGYVFARWTVGASQVSTAPSYTFNVNANKTLVANFVPVGAQQTIATSASPVAGGSTSGGGVFASGDSATVVATANPGYAFSKWREGSTTVSTSPSYTFTVGGSRNLVAKFDEAFVITATSSPAVGGTTEVDSPTYQPGENAKVKAFPVAGYSFANWTVNGVIVSTNTTYQFNVTGNRALVANFLSNTGVTVTTNAVSAEGGSTFGEGAYALNDIVTVAAQANEGFGFVNWTEGGIVVSTDAEFSFVADANHALVAHFAAAVPIDAIASTDIGGWVAGADFYGLGASITVYAEAYEGYTFTNWTVAGAVVSTDPFYSFTVTGARSLVANFNPFPAVALTTGAPGSHALILSWPNADPGWVLQESTDLVEWVNSTRPVTIVGGQRTVPASATGACRYFRLVHP